MIYLLIFEEYPLDIGGRVKVNIQGYTNNKTEAEVFLNQNISFNFGRYIYKEVREYKATCEERK